MNQKLRTIALAGSLALAMAALPSAFALPTITQVVQTGGDDNANTPAQFTGQTFTHPNLGSFTVGTLAEDAPAYRDRTHQYNGATATMPIPDYLLGGEYIMIRNDNRDNAALQLDVTISEPALIYVLVDNRLTDGSNADGPESGLPPEFWSVMTWLGQAGFQPVLNGLNRLGDSTVADEIGMDESGDGTGPGAGINQYMSVYRKEVTAGTYTFLQADAAGRDMYGIVVKRLSNSANNPPEITSISPTNNVARASAAAGLTITATTLVPNTLAPSNIVLTLNGQNVSSNLLVTGTGTSRTIRYTNLVENAFYRAHLEVRDQTNRVVTRDFSFDTFNPSTAKFVEAEDYNYDSGKFVASATPGAYAGLTGTAGVDYNDSNTTAPAPEYRPTDFVNIVAATDVAKPEFLAASATDYQVGQFRAGDWMNYTRSFAAGRYHVYLRTTSSAPQDVRLDLVSAATGTAQTVAALGTFQIPNTGSYTYVPLTDLSGKPVSVQLSGEQTLRLTGQLSANPNAVLNHLVFVATTGTQSPYLAAIAPGNNETDVALSGTLNATIANGAAAVPPTSVRLFFNGQDVTSTASITPGANGTAVSFDPPGNLTAGQSYPVRLVFGDNAGGTVTNDWSFRTLRYKRIITRVVEIGGDDDLNTPAQYTGQTFPHPNLGTLTIPSFGEDVPAFRDRTHQWNGATAALPIPDYLVGAEYIMSRNDNRENVPFQMDVTVSEPALLYVLVDNRQTDNDGNNPPETGLPLDQWTTMLWLSSNGFQPVTTGYNRTGNRAIPDEVAVDEGGDGTGPGGGVNQYASIYVKEIPAGTFSLFEAENPGRNMYGVVIKPVSEAVFPPILTLSPSAPTVIANAPTNVTLTVSASARNSTITNVQFFSGTNLIGSDTTEPFSLTWSNVPAGRYYISARAQAANGSSTATIPNWLVVGNVISVNFQDLSAETPLTYLPDVGNIFGDQGNGYSYGWDDDNTANARNRNSALSPDERYDTFNHMQKPLPAGQVWEIQIPNGRYRVTAVAGEATATDSVYDLQFEGTTIVSGTPSASRLFLEGTGTVTVSDGRLTLSNGPTAVNNKIAFLDIVPLGAETEPPNITSARVAGGNITVTWTGGGTLQGTSSLTAPATWTDLSSSGSYSEPANGTMKFFRVRR